MLRITSKRPARSMLPTLALRIALVLLIVIGLSGASVALTLGWALGNVGLGFPSAGIAIVGGMLAYGAALTASGVGLILRRRWAWPLGVVGLVVGLAVLLWVLAIARGNDAVTAGGVVIWAVTLALLLAGRSARPR